MILSPSYRPTPSHLLHRTRKKSTMPRWTSLRPSTINFCKKHSNALAYVSSSSCGFLFFSSSLNQDEHGVDLQALRAESQASIEQVRGSHEATIQNLKAEHATALDEQVKTLEKHILTQNLELKATQDDLAKAKAALASSLQEFESIKSQLGDARKNADSIASTSASDQSSELNRLRKEISNAREDQEALKEVLGIQNESFAEMSDSHSKELEEAAKGRADEVIKLRAAHEAETATLSKEKSELATRLSDLEGELATLKANLGAEPVSVPKTNGATHASPGVTKEEIQRMHEAHNLKMNDMEAEFEKTLRVLKEELDAAQSKSTDLELEVNRKGMEINYLESDQDEQASEITRYVRFYAFRSFMSSLFALAVMFGLA